MSMSKKHYTALADLIKDYNVERLDVSVISNAPLRRSMENAALLKLVRAFSAYMKEDNPNFSPSRFMNAVFPIGGVVIENDYTGIDQVAEDLTNNYELVGDKYVPTSAAAKRHNQLLKEEYASYVEAINNGQH